MSGLRAVVVGGDRAAWRSLGFVGDGELRFGNGAIVVTSHVPLGIVRFLIHGGGGRAGERVSVDGVDCEVVERVGIRDDLEGAEHPNTAFELDHVVLTTDSLERTCAAVDGVLGLPLKRVRDLGDVRQGFHRFADEPLGRGCIVEVVESPAHREPGVATPWGLVVNLRDLERVDGVPHVGPARDAVQTGRRIATVSRDAGLGTAVALMSPEPGRVDRSER